MRQPRSSDTARMYARLLISTIALRAHAQDLPSLAVDIKACVHLSELDDGFIRCGVNQEIDATTMSPGRRVSLRGTRGHERTSNSIRLSSAAP